MAADDGSNLITRALAAVGREAAVHVVKRIPLGGGLGGGSTDAAAVLRWAGCNDLDVARALGSDVPFSVPGGRALVEGTGEKITPLPFEARRVPSADSPVRRQYGAGLRGLGRGDQDESRAGGTGGAEGVNALDRCRARGRAAAGRVARRLRALTGRPPTLAGSGSTWFVEVDPPRAPTRLRG